jgi:hypothetical protein
VIFLDGNVNESIGNVEGQGPPPYQPPPGQPYPQDPYGPPPQYPPQPYPQPYGPPPGPMPRQQTAKPLFAGILLIVFGLINIGFALYLIIAVDAVLSMIPDVAEEQLQFIKDFVMVCGIIGIIMSVIAIIGGYFATQRTKFGIAIIGSIVGLFTLGPLCLSSLTALIALILLYMSKDEFT